ncbi:hypothetical protein PCAU_4910 [Pseudomonas chlororaphis subsp. aurantiaca]|uniref:hypothetical protein n=1 Tax=Pseudomonas chlororaphis TaxID=587753 RepID=UPI000865DB46|nr:hypothetical protein [Pseudomonas chlororaphis]BAV77119.1 hypothetical protein PCAU_4910 [Pseudomonas chlororaphis subsp. aurantiaca]
MKNLFTLLFVMLCASCAKNHGKTPANLEFVSTSRIENFTAYTIHFNSDVDLLDLYGKGRGRGQISTKLLCALGADQDFTVGHFMEPSASGLIEDDTLHSSREKFSYLTSALLSDTFEPTQPKRTIHELNQLLANKQNIPCKAVITAFGYKAYYSNTLQLPVAGLLHEINKPKTP